METNVKHPIPDKELKRVLELTEFELDYSELDKNFSDLTKLAAKVAGTDVSLINLIDSFTQWTIANYGIQITQMPRETSICQYTIMGDEPMEVEDIRSDVRSKSFITNNPDSSFKYYLGIPLKTREGSNIGALCVLDEEEADLTPEKIEMLSIIADEVVDRLVSLKAINEIKRELDEANQSKRKFSHDIRGPLGGIVGLAKIIEEQINDNDLKGVIELAEMIRKGGDSLLELADDILSKKAEEHSEPTEFEFNLSTLKNKLEQLFTPQAAAKDIDLVIANHSENAEIPFPKQKIVQIIGNLISNAIKFTPEGGMVMMRQEFVKSESECHLKFTVKDSGKGVSNEKIQEIKSGNAKSTSGTGGETGYGFGLSLVKHLIDGMDGELHIESVEGDGCKFDVILPV